MRNGAPDAILLDFGGVLVDIVHRPGALREIALEVHALLRREHANSLDAGRVERDVRAGWDAYDRWKSAEGRRARPREMTHREFWEELVGADWPAPARATVADHATELCKRLDVATKDALCGAGSRDLVRLYGFEPYLGAQVYSDEAGVRKPNPEIFEGAARLLGVELSRCWYVGDTIDRDVLGGRRAGIAKVLLMPSSHTGRGNDAVAEPDAVIQRPSDVLTLLSSTA
ncbi:MAG: HAD family hydrolase [Chloroflexi bacterium]|nr:MAG: HAD family hydrolase [Chloroflexota bacterium]